MATSLKINGNTIRIATRITSLPLPKLNNRFVTAVSSALDSIDWTAIGNEMNAINTGVKSAMNAHFFQIYQYQTAVGGFAIMAIPHRVFCILSAFGVCVAWITAQIQKIA